jgi:hypothetical protein
LWRASVQVARQGKARPSTGSERYRTGWDRNDLYSAILGLGATLPTTPTPCSGRLHNFFEDCAVFTATIRNGHLKVVKAHSLPFSGEGRRHRISVPRPNELIRTVRRFGGYLIPYLSIPALLDRADWTVTGEKRVSSPGISRSVPQGRPRISLV